MEANLTPEERIREYEDVGKCIRYIEKRMLECPQAFKGGLLIPDEANDTNMTLYVDESGVYGTVDHNGKRRGIKDVKEAVKIAQMSYLSKANGGLRYLTEAVMKLGKRYVFQIGEEDGLIITPMGDDVDIKFLNM